MTDHSTSRASPLWTHSAWALAVLLPAAIVATGYALGAGVAVLSVAALAMLAAIAAFWASLRTLSGESPLSPEDAYALGASASEDDQKRALLRALEDLEHDRQLGRVEQADYEALAERYRSEAQALLGVGSADSEELRARVERELAARRERELAEELEQTGDGARRQDRPRRPDDEDAAPDGDEAGAADAGGDAEADDEARDSGAPSPDATPNSDAPSPEDAPDREVAREEAARKGRRGKRRPSCKRCGSPNDRDAKFCKRCGKPLGALLVIALVLVSSVGAGQPGASSATAVSTAPRPPATATGVPPSPSASAPPDGSAPPLMPPPLPDAAMGGELPPGHPDISQMLGGGASPAGPRGMPRPRRPSNVLEDPALPEGSIEVVVIDAADEPLPQAPLELSVLRRTTSGMAEADRIEARTDETGHYRFDALPVGEGISYWLGTTRDGGEFFVDPFGLPEDRGVRVRLRALESTSNPAETDLEVWAMVALEVRESGLLVEHVLRISNAGPKAWVPKGVTLALPAGAGELEAPETMSGSFVRESNGAVELVGTFAVGVTDLRYRYQVPLGDGSEQSLALDVPPASSWIRVVAPVVAGLGLEVAGLGTAKPGRSPEGQRLLVAEQRVEQAAAASTRRLIVTVTGLPGAGAARWVALGASGLALLWGLAVAWRRRRQKGPGAESLREAREVLLDEIVALERARGAGGIDRALFESTRRGLVDALVRIDQRLGAESR